MAKRSQNSGCLGRNIKDLTGVTEVFTTSQRRGLHGYTHSSKSIKLAIKMSVFRCIKLKKKKNNPPKPIPRPHKRQMTVRETIFACQEIPKSKRNL